MNDESLETGRVGGILYGGTGDDCIEGSHVRSDEETAGLHLKETVQSESGGLGRVKAKAVGGGCGDGLIGARHIRIGT